MEPENLTLGTDRLLFFSDAVYAISITLLVLEIRVPASIDMDSNTAVWHALGDLIPNIAAYVLSFLVVGSLWIANHRNYSSLKAYDTSFIWLNLILLMAIAFIPFPTSLISSSETVPAVVLYAATMAATGFISAWKWLYATSRDLIGDDRVGDRKRGLLAPLSLSLVFGASLLLLPLGIDYVRYSWVLLIPALRLSH